jgi:hypothetical protein
MDPAENADLIYRVRLLIRHPHIDPDSITAKLGLSPSVSHMVGHERKTPTGTPLPGVHKRTTWSYSVRVEGKRFFSEDVADLVSRLEESAAFLRELTDTGGSAELSVSLPGDVNIGDVIRWPDLQKIASLRIDFGVEVFPRWNRPTAGKGVP